MIIIKQKKSTLIVFILTATAAISTLVWAAADFLIPMYFKYKFRLNASNVASIGGADGPTAIYISCPFSSHLFTIIFAILTVIGISYLIIKKSKLAKRQ